MCGFDTPFATNRFDWLSAAAQGYSTTIEKIT